MLLEKPGVALDEAMTELEPETNELEGEAAGTEEEPEAAMLDDEALGSAEEENAIELDTGVGSSSSQSPPSSSEPSCPS